MARIKQIQNENWPNHMATFTNGNRGRMVSVSVTDDESVTKTLVKQLPLLGLDFDPINKGDDMVISLGKSTLEVSHTIDAPVELFEKHNDLGVVTNVEIIDQNNNKIAIDFI